MNNTLLDHLKILTSKISYLLVFIIFMSACSKDDPEAIIPDTTKPLITIIAPTDLTNPLRATVIVKAEATDDTGITKVEVFVDGTSIASATSSPVEASWNTKTVTDGSHVIKIVAEDAEGNKEEKSLTVAVQNILFTIPVGAAYITDKTEQWVFISDENGGVVSVKQLENGQTYVVNTPEGFTKDQRYYFTRLQYYFDDFGGLGSLYTDSYFVTFAHVKPGTYTLDFEQRTTPQTVGNHTIFVSGSPTNLSYSVLSLDARQGYFLGSVPALPPLVVPAVAFLSTSPADLLYYFYDYEDVELGKNIAPRYHRIQNATSDGEEIVDYASLSEMDFNTINFVGATESYYSISYLKKAGEYQNSEQLIYQFNLVSPNELKMYTPEISFPEYITDISYKMGNNDYFYEKVSTQIASDFKQIQGNITDFSKSGKKITLQTSGTYTHAGVSSYQFSVEDNGDASSYGWVIYGPRGSTVEFTIPEIPAEIITKHPGVSTASYNFGDPILHNYIGLPDYDAVVNARFTGKSIYNEVKERTTVTTSFAGSGGRVGRKQKEWLQSHNIPIVNTIERRNQ